MTLDRKAVFDNDGALWLERPSYFQLRLAWRALLEGPRRGWTIASMKADWKTVHPARRP